MEAVDRCDIREIRPAEAAAALAMLEDGVEVERLERRLSVGAFDCEDGTLQGVALHATLAHGGGLVRLVCQNPNLGRLLLDRALQKAAAVGRRTTQVTLQPEAAAAVLWSASSWPTRRAHAVAEPAVQAQEPAGAGEIGPAAAA